MSIKRWLPKIDLLALALFPLIATWITLSTSQRYLFAILLFYGLPALYLTLRTPHRALRALVFTLITFLPIGIAGAYIAEINLAWRIDDSLFAFRILESIAVEELLNFGLLIYCAVIAFEHFAEKGKHDVVEGRLKDLALFLFLFMVVFLTMLPLSDEGLRFSYAYLWGGVIGFLVPVVTYLSFVPERLSAFVRIASYLVVINLLFEVAGLQLGYWSFPGEEFIGWIEISSFRLPLEELLFWIVLPPIATLTYFSFFDERKPRKQS